MSCGNLQLASKLRTAVSQFIQADAPSRRGLIQALGRYKQELNHLVMADAGYVASLGGGRAVWAVADNETNDLRELAARAQESGARWERFLREPIDGERLAFLDDGAYETHAAVVVMQALHHVSIHWAVDTFSLVRIWASTDARHVRSRRVLEKLGMQPEAVRVGDHIGRVGELVDEVVYGLNLAPIDNSSP